MPVCVASQLLLLFQLLAALLLRRMWLPCCMQSLQTCSGPPQGDRGQGHLLFHNIFSDINQARRGLQPLWDGMGQDAPGLGSWAWGWELV